MEKTFLFSGIPPKIVEEVLAGTPHRTESFSKGDVILSPLTDGSIIGFVISGVCSVERIRLDENPVPLNTLKKYDSFGILSVFAKDEEYPTRISVRSRAEILFFEGSDFTDMIKRHPELSLNVIRFLCRKVSFLNSKIATFSEKNTLSRLCAHLLCEYKRSCEPIPLCATRLSGTLGVGRASVYRDLAVLEEQNIIAIENKKIYIKSPDGLERNKK